MSLITLRLKGLSQLRRFVTVSITTATTSPMKTSNWPWPTFRAAFVKAHKKPVRASGGSLSPTMLNLPATRMLKPLVMGLITIATDKLTRRYNHPWPTIRRVSVAGARRCVQAWTALSSQSTPRSRVSKRSRSLVMDLITTATEPPITAFNSPLHCVNRAFAWGHCRSVMDKRVSRA